MPRTIKQYNLHGLAGLVAQRRCRKTGRLVGLYNAEQAGLDPEGGPWVTVCEEHGILCNHRSLALAYHHMTDPEGWCELCRRAAET